MLNNRDLEDIVLGSLIIDNRLMEENASLLSEELFTTEEGVCVFRAIKKLYDSDEPIDMISVSIKIKSNGHSDIVTPHYVVSLTRRIGSTTNFTYHVLKLKELCLRRKLLKEAKIAEQKANDLSLDVFDILNETEASIISISENDSEKGAKLLDDYVIEVVKDIEILNKENVDFIGFRTGFSDIDKITCGLKGGSFNVLAARPAMGKTSLMMSMVMNGIKHEKYPALIVSIEMQGTELVYRLISSETEIYSQRLKTGNINDSDFTTIHDKMSPNMNESVYIYDGADCTLNTIKRQARKIKASRGGVSIIAIDYIQLISSVDDGTKKNREQEVSTISRGLKKLAKEMDCPILALAQLNRNVDKSAGVKMPTLSDIRESGSIEQDADLVMFIHRPEYYGITELEGGESTQGIATIRVAKNRHGRTGEVNIRFIAEYTKFVDNHNNFQPTFAYDPDERIEPLKPNPIF